jgi:hypothetical protein
MGIGVGIGIQYPLIVIQTLSEKYVPVGTALITLVQIFFGAVFGAITQNIFKISSSPVGLVFCLS